MNLLTRKNIAASLVLLLVLIVAGFSLLPPGLDIPYLASEKNASWVYINRSFFAEAQREGEHVSYRTRFDIAQVPGQAVLTVRALRVPEVYLDGKHIPPLSSHLGKWKGIRTFDIAPSLTPGTHEIVLRVYNQLGPAPLLAYCSPLSLATGPEWDASYDELLWTKAVPASGTKDAELSAQFGSSFAALRSLLPLYIPLFLAVFLASLLAASPRFDMRGRLGRLEPTPSGLRWTLIALWTVLAVNNIFKVPIEIGMDIQQHYEYIEYVANRARIPLAPEGWQMFQSPLYYILSAFLWKFPLSRWFSLPVAMLLLRIIPLLCGVLQVELAYRAARTVFPERKDLQRWGTVLGGLLPMNLYISQVVGNEPLSGLFSALTVVLGFMLYASERETLPRRNFVFLGIALGLALLTKVTAVLLVPLVAVLVLDVLHARGYSLRQVLGTESLVLGIVAAIAAWYYIRNWVELGRPFVGGWEASRWWQDPGYRTASDFLAFGSSLVTPIYSAVRGFWDSLYSTLWLDGGLSGIGVYQYRPPWNYPFLLSEALLSIVPTAGLLLGIAATVNKPSLRAHRAQLFSICCIAIYYAALLYLYLTVPIWSTAKATYTLGLMPCYVILSVTGLDVLSRNSVMRAAVNASLACWAVASYCSYFVL